MQDLLFLLVFMVQFLMIVDLLFIINEFNTKNRTMKTCKNPDNIIDFKSEARFYISVKCSFSTCNLWQLITGIIFEVFCNFPIPPPVFQDKMPPCTLPNFSFHSKLTMCLVFDRDSKMRNNNN